MTVTSATTFDVEAFKRAYEQWDIEALLDLYADDVELVQDRAAASVTCEFPGGPQGPGELDPRDPGWPHHPRARRRVRRSQGGVTMRRTTITIAAAVALLMGSSAVATAQQPASAQASCVALITSYEATQLAAGSVGSEVSGLAKTPGLGSTLVSPLAKTHLGSIGACVEAE